MMCLYVYNVNETERRKYQFNETIALPAGKIEEWTVKTTKINDGNMMTY